MQKMSRLWMWITCSALTLTVFMPTVAMAAAKRADVVIVADTRFLGDGLLYWWAEMYNESHLAFAIMTMLIIPVLGCILGFTADFFMNMIGIDLKKRELAEH